MSNYSYELFEVLDDEDKADVLLNELAYRMFNSIKSMDADELMKITDKTMIVVDKLRGY